MRDSSIFYRSFYEAINELPDLNKLEVYTAIFEYSFNFNEIELSGLSKTIFTLIKPQLEANKKRFENGTKAKGKPEKSKTEAKQKQNRSKVEANNNVNNNVNNNDNENINYNLGKNNNIFLSDNEYKKLCEEYTVQKTNQAIDYLSDWGVEKPKQFKEYKNHNLTLRRWVFDAIDKKPAFNHTDPKLESWFNSSMSMIKQDLRTHKEHNDVVRQNKYDSKYLLPE
jgi:hypothetical protein